jgi:type IV fimbrial biogenesis protein FimT
MERQRSHRIAAHRTRGFTLLELLVAVAILAIVTTVAVPSLRSLVERNRVTSLGNDLVHDLALARAEAVRRNSRVTVCRSATLAQCSRDGGWEVGWIMFADDDDDATRDDGEALLATRAAVDGPVRIRGDARVGDHVTYSSVGRAVNGTFEISSGSHRRNVVLYNARARIVDTGP